MSMRKCSLSLFAFVAVVLTVQDADALGFKLGETKEQLKLDYEVSATDHGTGRVTLVLTIADPGRMGPLTGVQLEVQRKEGTGYVDLSVALDMEQRDDGSLVVRAHLSKDLAERAEFQLRTLTIDGKQQPLTWYYYSIPFADYLGEKEQAK